MNENRFVAAWKKGIKKVGEEFFNIKASSLDAAKKKWQLEPDYHFIMENIWGYSHGKQVLIGLMYSFFDGEDGQKILEMAKRGLKSNGTKTYAKTNPPLPQAVSRV